MPPGSGGRRPAKPRAKNSKAANRSSRGGARASSGHGRISKRRSHSHNTHNTSRGDRAGRARGGPGAAGGSVGSSRGVGRSRSDGHALIAGESDGRRVGKERDREAAGEVGIAKKRTNLKGLRRERWGAEKSAAHKKSCAEGRQRKAEDDHRRQVAIARGEEPPARRHAANKRIRVKGGEKRGRILVVRGAGDPHPKARGRIPKTDLPVKTDAFDDDMFVARKARELFAPPEPLPQQDKDGAGVVTTAPGKGNGNINSNKVFDSMQEGETLEGFKARINAEVKQAHLALAKTNNHQRAKKRAYYERKREKAQRKKRRKKGIFSDDDDNDDTRDDNDGADDGYDEDGNYTNNGALTAMIDMMHERMADNQRKNRKGRKLRHRVQQQGGNRNRDEDETPWDSPRINDATAPRFGEQAMRPPLLAFTPTVKGGKRLAKKNQNGVVASNAYHLIK